MRDDTNRNDSSLKCREAQPLIGAYLDGELSETRAALLRKHLMDCVACRGGAQDGKQLQRWFGALRDASAERGSEFAAPVPAGFASRVARRAFAGDDGERSVELRPAAPQEGRLLRFVTRLTAVAAAAALLLAAAYRAQSRPSGDRLSADDRAPLSIQEIHDRLDRLNRSAKGAADQDASLEPGSDARSRARKRAEERSGD